MSQEKFILPDTAFDPIDEEEAEIMAAIEAGSLKASKTVEADKALLQAAAKNSIAKKKPVTIRLDPDDIEGIQEEARERGIPYQTLISSVLHQYRTGRLVTR